MYACNVMMHVHTKYVNVDTSSAHMVARASTGQHSIIGDTFARATRRVIAEWRRLGREARKYWQLKIIQLPVLVGHQSCHQRPGFSASAPAAGFESGGRALGSCAYDVDDALTSTSIEACGVL